MASEAIFLPMLGLMVLTALVWLYMYSVRIPAMRKLGRPAQTYTTPDTLSLLPDRVNYPANNLRNLFELPVLFYGLCIYLFVTENVDDTYLVAAWLFVTLRALHSIVHCLWNNVMQRFVLYASGAIVLWFMLMKAAFAAFVSW